jgi:hypothetical protein
MGAVPVEVVTGPHWLEIISWVCQILLTLLAFVAAYFAYAEIEQIKEDSAQQLKNSHATLLLSIDARWENDMREVRERPRRPVRLSPEPSTKEG